LGVDPDRRSHLLAKLLRGLVIVVAVLVLIVCVLAFIPSVEIYEGARLVGTGPPVRSGSETVVYFGMLLVFGWRVWSQPTLASALTWTLWTIIVSGVMTVLTFAPFHDGVERVVQLPLAYVFGAAVTALLVALIVVIPIGCLVFAILTRTRPPPPPVFPTARIVER
jgi:hypothetical protein